MIMMTMTTMMMVPILMKMLVMMSLMQVLMLIKSIGHKDLRSKVRFQRAKTVIQKGLHPEQLS
jgi:hypothetical protein